MNTGHRWYAAAAGCILVGQALAADAPPGSTVQLYGQVRLTANHLSSGSAGSKTELRDNASRLGFRGREDLGGGLGANFELEMGVDADTGAATVPQFRDSHVGLTGSWGALSLGRLDSSNPTGSPLYSQVTSIVSFAPNDAGATAIGTSMLNARNRTSNALGYMSPTWNGLNLRARYYMRGTTAAPDTEDGSRSVDLGVNYAAGPIRAAVGYGNDRRHGGLLANELSHKWQAGLRYDFGDIEPYVLVGREFYNKTRTSRHDVDYWLVGARYSTGVHALTLNVIKRDVQTSLTGERRRWQLGYTYALSKRTELQAFYDHDGVDSSRNNVRVRAFGVGMRHDF